MAEEIEQLQLTIAQMSLQIQEKKIAQVHFSKLQSEVS